MNGLIVETHELTTDTIPCEVTVTVDDCGDVRVILDDDIDLHYDDFREIIEFVGVHGLGMKSPYLVEYDDVKKRAQ